MSEISKNALKVVNNQNFPDNNTGYITPTKLREFNVDMIDSTVNQASYSVDIAAIQSDITALEAFTASQQPTFNALNSFTASQIVTNNALNAFTQSAGQELDSLSAWTGSWNTWTSSINEIRDDGVLQGYSTRFFFNGLVSASIVQNVNGPIANVTVEHDGTKLDTASFNTYTASAAASQSLYSASVSQSIYALNQYTASEESQINPFTASVNAFTASTEISITSLNSFSQSVLDTYATTGSNVFRGGQQIYGDVTISGSVTLATEGGDGHAYSGKALFLTNSVQTGITVESPIHFYQVGKGNFYITNNVAGVGSGSINIQAINNAPLNISASNAVLTSNALTMLGNADVFLGGDPYSVYNGIGLTQANQNYGIIAYASSSAILNFGAVDYNSFSYSTEVLATATPSEITFQDFSFGDYSYQTWLTLQANNGSNPKPFFNRGIRTSGSVEITGSVYGNVTPVSIVSSTASIDLSKANYFTLTLGGTTKINVINPQPGVTATLVINTDTAASASFSSNVKQPSGSLYVASPSGNIDIISFTAVNSNTVYAFPAQSFI